MKKIVQVTICLIFFLGITGNVFAGKYTYNPSGRIYHPNGSDVLDYNASDMDDLDHHFAYEWGIDISNISQNETIIGATLYFNNIQNWDSNANVMHMSVLNDPSTGITAQYDDETDTNLFADRNISPYTDNELFHWNNINTTYRDIAITLTKDAYESDLLALPEFIPPSNYNINNGDENDYWRNYTVYNESGTSDPNTGNPTDATLWDGVGDGGTLLVNTDALDKMLFYVQDNILGLGFDPDCHFNNNGVSLILWTKTSTTDVVPEPTSLLLFGAGLLFAASRIRRKTVV